MHINRAQQDHNYKLQAKRIGWKKKQQHNS